MTLYGYIWPVSKNRPDIKCVIHKNKDIIYCGKVGDVPMKYGELTYQNVKINQDFKTLNIYVD